MGFASLGPNYRSGGVCVKTPRNTVINNFTAGGRSGGGSPASTGANVPAFPFFR